MIYRILLVVFVFIVIVNLSLHAYLIRVNISLVNKQASRRRIKWVLNVIMVILWAVLILWD